MKKATLLAVFFIAMLALTGCANKQNANPNFQTDNQPGGNGRGRMPDFGQPDKQADISGLVKTISGNQVTIIKIDRPNRGQASSTPANGMNGPANNQNRNGNNLGRALSGEAGGGGRFMGGGGGQRPDGQNADNRTAMLEQIKKMSTGEVIVTIPVGIKMLKPDIAASGREPSMIEATLADIAADKMINIWTDESGSNASTTDKKVASFVLITR